MTDISTSVIVALLEEVFGRGLFWLMFGAAISIATAYLYVLVRDRAVSWRKFLLSQLSMSIGAVVAIVFILSVTHSTFADIGGAIDVIVVTGLAAAGAIGMAILVYTAQPLIWRRCLQRMANPA